MFYGLTNSPEPFMNLMKRVFKSNLDLFVIIFIDHILVYLRNEEDHVSHKRIVLQTLKDKELYVKFLRCVFCLMFVALLFHIIFGDGIRVYIQWIEAVNSWPRATSLTDIMSFLGLVCCYRRFVEGFFIYLISFFQAKS